MPLTRAHHRRGVAVLGRWLPLLELQRRLQDQHLQDRPRMGAGSVTCGSAAATSAQCVRRTSSSCTPAVGPARRFDRSVRGRDRHGRASRRIARSRISTRHATGGSEPGRASTTDLLGGNPDLQPEKSDTYSVGVLLKPTWVPNLTVRSITSTSRSKRLSARSAATRSSTTASPSQRPGLLQCDSPRRQRIAVEEPQWLHHRHERELRLAVHQRRRHQEQLPPAAEPVGLLGVQP